MTVVFIRSLLLATTLLAGASMAARAEDFTTPIARQLVNSSVNLPVPADMCVMSARKEVASFYNMLSGVQAMVGNRLIEVIADCPSLDDLAAGKAKVLAQDYVMVALPADAAALAKLDNAAMIARIKPDIEAALGSSAVRQSAETILSSNGNKASASHGKLIETERGLIFPMKVETKEKTLAIRGFIGPVRHQPVLVYYYAPAAREELLDGRFGAYVDEMLRLNAADPESDIPLQIGLLVGLLVAAAGIGLVVLKKNKGVQT